MAKGDISHEGRVIAIDQECISVEFINKSACVSCHAKSVCMASDEKIKIIQVENSIEYVDYNVGDVVNILLKRSMGFKAVWLFYVIPLLILMVLLLSLSALKTNELIIGAVIVALLSSYYFVIYLCRDKLSKDFVFAIEKT